MQSVQRLMALQYWDTHFCALLETFHTLVSCSLRYCADSCLKRFPLVEFVFCSGQTTNWTKWLHVSNNRCAVLCPRFIQTKTISDRSNSDNRPIHCSLITRQYNQQQEAKIDIAYNHTKFDDALAVPKIFQGVWNSKIGHLALTTPTSGTVGHLKVSTSRGQPVHKILSL